MSFKLNEDTEAGDLVIENDRLKTSIAILNGKLKSQEDSEEIIESLRKRNQMLESENLDLKSQVSSLQTTIQNKQALMNQLEDELESSEDARRGLK